MADKRKIAVVLFNLGGPDSPKAVKPFLFNLFNDKAIISAPKPIRWIIAKLISSRRAPIAQEIYEALDGRSPLLMNTKAQATALDQDLASKLPKNYEVKSFIAMRYWHPFASETIEEVKNWGADEILLLPLYPQFSTTTSESSIHDWKRSVIAKGFLKPTKAVCCYHTADGFIQAITSLTEASLEALRANGINSDIRILYTAHGLPKKIIEAGDPYQRQVEETAKSIAAKLGPSLNKFENSDWVTCYQSRVGPLEWIKPYTEDEIERAGKDKKTLLVVPIAFISEHSETLVELDIEYKELAEKSGVKHYARVPTTGTHPDFISCLSDLVLKQVNGHNIPAIYSDKKERSCSDEFSRCICK